MNSNIVILRYLIAAIAGVIFSAAVFWVLNTMIHPGGIWIHDYWPIKMKCAQYEVTGRVIQSKGIAVENALIQADLGYELISTVSGVDGFFTLSGTKEYCGIPISSVPIQIQSDAFVPLTISVPYTQREIEIVLSE